MGIHTRYTTAVLILLVALATASTAHAATLHPVPSIARALAAGPSGVMPSGLTVQRSQQLGVMLLKANTQLALGSGAVVPVTRGASLSVSGLARTAVATIKNGNPAKILATAAVTGAIALIPGSEIRDGMPVKQPQSGPADYYTHSYVSNRRFGTAQQACIFGAFGQTTIPSGNSIRVVNGSCEITTVNTTPPTRFHGSAVAHRQTCYYGHTDYYCNPAGTWVPYIDADYDVLESTIVSRDPSPDEARDLWYAICGGDGSCLGSYTSDPTLDGPSSVQGPKTTTTSTGPSGTTTTTKDTQHDLDYSNPDGVVVRDRTTTTTTEPDGNTTTDTTVDTGPVVGAKPDDQSDFEGSFTDTPFPEVEPFYEQKYPDGLEGVWASRKAEFEDSAFMDFLGSFVPSFSGSCPGWSVNVNIASWAQFGIHDFQSLCWVFDFVKVVLLVSAAFLCRALIFGG